MKNWRTHPPEQRAAMVEMLNSVGYIQQVVVNRTTGNLVDGHLRVDLAVERGEDKIPVVYVDLTEAEEARVLAAYDSLGAMAGVDTERLESLLREMTMGEDALSAMLLNMARQSKIDLYPQPPALTDPDDVPAVPESPYVQRGEIYMLGEHRIMCGDSTDAADVARLLDSVHPTLMVTDPPYGVDYDPTWRDAVNVPYMPGVPRGERPKMAPGKRRRGAVAADDRADWSEAWALAPCPVAYVWHGGLHASEVQASLEATGFAMRAQIIWVKQAFVFGRGHYHWQHEPCWYAVRKGAAAAWGGDRTQATTWMIDNANLHKGGTKDDADTDHSTQKPVECMERPIRNHTGDVYDPFVGSGTTIIAAERARRRCYAMEIEPRYAQVAIERWQNYTGMKAALL